VQQEEAGVGESGGDRDQVRTLELLWGTRATSGLGRKPGLNLERIVSAAVGVADSDGLTSLSMRRVAERLGVGAMSLYRHVQDKTELLDLMIDRVLAEVRYDEDADRAGVGDDGAGWRSRLERVARANRAIYERHPWLLGLPASRPPLGPGVVAKYDAELHAVDGIGLSDVEMDLALTLVLGYARDATASLLEWRSLPERSGEADDEWWARLEPHMARVLDDRYALAVRVGTAASTQYDGVHDAERAWEFGLQRILDGLESFVGRG
jgi:AcrR family transcriptional regulator